MRKVAGAVESFALTGFDAEQAASRTATANTRGNLFITTFHHNGAIVISSVLMKRRNFLFSSAAMAAPFAGSSASAAESGPGDIKLGVATYSFRSFQRDLCIKYVKQLG